MNNIKYVAILVIVAIIIVSCSKFTIDQLPIPSEVQKVIQDNNFEK